MSIRRKFKLTDRQLGRMNRFLMIIFIFLAAIGLAFLVTMGFAAFTMDKVPYLIPTVIGGAISATIGITGEITRMLIEKKLPYYLRIASPGSAAAAAAAARKKEEIARYIEAQEANHLLKTDLQNNAPNGSTYSNVNGAITTRTRSSSDSIWSITPDESEEEVDHSNSAPKQIASQLTSPLTPTGKKQQELVIEIQTATPTSASVTNSSSSGNIFKKGVIVLGEPQILHGKEETRSTCSI